MVLVMKELKVLGLGSELAITPKPLPSKKLSIVGVIEAFHDSITPRFSYRDEDNLDTHHQAESQNDAKGTRVAIASTETEFVVELKEVGDAHGFPATDQALSDCSVVFAPLGMDKDPVTVKVDHMERIEAAVVFDIARSQQVGLVDVVAPQRLPEVGVFHSFGLVRGFF